MPKRLDVYLSDNNIVKSRSLAATLIKQGSVEVNGRICTKPSFTVGDGDNVKIIGELPKYVGRGGLKLEKALAHYRLHLDGTVCIDIGASTGGFTDCMLQNGAAKVYSVDVGTDQLDEKLRNDSRVISMEKTDIRNCVGTLPQVDFISIDVSFISLKLVLPSAFALLKDGGECVALIKPQFEAGKAHLSKNGIVRDAKVHKKVCDDIAEFASAVGFERSEIIPSPITGGDGNTEYLIYLKRLKAGDRL
jgi:23S rRNA (cytidine1920-2'-O)/16S rRNA (cytidine1409-2'-O)-methyltransferase